MISCSLLSSRGFAEVPRQAVIEVDRVEEEEEGRFKWQQTGPVQEYR